jgi:hypothetical protein
MTLMNIMFELARPASIGLVSVAPKKVMPTTVVNQSIKPTSISMEKNSMSFFMVGVFVRGFSYYQSILQTHTYPSRMVKNTTDMHVCRSFNMFNVRFFVVKGSYCIVYVNLGCFVVLHVTD